jgi:hypothetical protein
MASLISALDNASNSRYGENGHKEYGWNLDNIQEGIVQLFFQTVRTNITTANKLADQFIKLYNNSEEEYRIILIRFILQTRDIDKGKGEYNLSLVFLSKLIMSDCETGMRLLEKFVGFNQEKDFTPYGSWKDIKYFLNILKDSNLECFQKIITMTNTQLKKDVAADPKDKSLVAKWISREKSRKFGWQFEFFAKDYFSNYGKYGWNGKAIKKALTHYRKLLSEQNKILETTQIFMCGKDWKSINFNKVTSITNMKQKKAFLNNKQKELEDRVTCAENYKKYIEDVKSGKKEIKAKNVSMYDFVKDALGSHRLSQEEQDVINLSWNKNSSYTKDLENMVVISDTSGSMETENCQPLYSCIGLSIRVAEKSKLGNRVLTFSERPTWVNLEGKKSEKSELTFIEKVNKLKHAEWGYSTNIAAAFRLIIDAILEAKMTPQEVEGLILVIFSDMQFDQATKENKQFDIEVEKLFASHDMKPPHILYWNLRSTNGFPSVSSRKNVSMLSGYSPALLNSFQEKGMDMLNDLNPWKLITEILNVDRYNF